MMFLRGWIVGLVLATALSSTATPQEPKQPERKVLTPEQTEKLKERTVLDKAAQEASAKGNIKEALEHRTKALAITREVFGPKSIQVAAALTLIGNMNMSAALEDWSAARVARKEALEIFTKAYGKENWNAVDARLRLADVDLIEKLSPEDRLSFRNTGSLLDEGGKLERERRFSEARKRFEEARDTTLRIAGKEHTRYADCLYRLSQHDSDRAAYSEALSLILQVLEVRKKTLGEFHPEYLRALNHQGVLYIHLRRLEDAERVLSLATDHQKKVLGLSTEYANSLGNLGSVYEKLGDHVKAETAFLESAKILRTTVGETHPNYAATLNSLALCYLETGQLSKSEPLLRQALAIRAKNPGETSYSYAVSLNNLGRYYYETRDLPKAEKLYEQSLALREKILGKNHPDTITAVSNLAQTRAKFGKFAEAIPLLIEVADRAAQRFGESSSENVMALNNVAVVYLEAGDVASAEKVFRKAIDIGRSTLGDHPNYAIPVCNLGMLYHRSGAYEKAEPLLTQALKLRESSLGSAHREYPLSLLNLGMNYLATHATEKSEPLLKQALDRNLELLMETAFAQSEQAQMVFASSLRMYFNHYLQASISHAVDSYSECLRWKGQVYLRQRRQRELADAANDPKTSNLASQLIYATRQLSALVGQTPAPGQAAEWRKQVAALTIKRETLERELTRASSNFGKGQTREALTPAKLREQLPPETAIVDFVVYDFFTFGPKGAEKEVRLVAFIVRPDKDIVRIEMGSFEPIREAIDAWRKDTERKKPVRDDDDPAAILREKLWRPVAQHLDGIRTVLVSPDEDLSKLPFGALPGSKDGQYLIEEIAIAVIPVPQALTDLLTPLPTGNFSLLLVGDVDYGASPGKPAPGAATQVAVRGNGGKGWKALPATREEVVAINKSFEVAFPGRATKTLRAGEPTEDSLRKAIGQYRWIHLATHGFFAPPEVKALTTGESSGGQIASTFQTVTGYLPGLLSGIVLSGANSPVDPVAGGDDGILTAAEVATLNLQGVETVVLSACETGLGRTAGGEGVLGLQRAFQIAGARTVVASLWEVPDEATRVLMTRTYENWWSGKKSKLDGLIEAQRKMLKEGVPGPDGKPGRGRTPPLYWAAFVLSGDWR